MRLPFRLASRFVAAETLEDTLPILADLRAKGLHTTLDLLGEYVDDIKLAEHARDNFLRIIDALAERRELMDIDGNISIKLSMMGQKIDERFCVRSLRKVLDQAKANDVFVRLDMEGTDICQSTMSIFEEVYGDYPDNVGIVLQAYLKRTEKDVQRMCDLNARVRLCKGAYKEPASLAYQKMSEIRSRFIDYAKELIGNSRYPGIATHDDALINATKDFAGANGITSDRFEFQMLFGMRPNTQLKLAEEGFNMRVYVPYGTEWLPYFTRRLRERKENIWFVARTFVKQ